MKEGQNLKVAILLGDRSLETLIRARALARALLLSMPLRHKVTDIVFGLPFSEDGMWHDQANFISGKLAQTTVRRMSWERVLSDNVRRMFEHLRLPIFLAGIERVVLPRDWGANFLDCDLWMVLESVTPLGVYPARPTAVFCFDLAQRRVPEAYALTIDAPFWIDQTAAFRLWRQSSIVIASDPTTAEDLLSYAGVWPDKVFEMHYPLDGPSLQVAQRKPTGSDNLLIRFEPDRRYAVDIVLRGLRLYEDEGGKLRPIFATETPLDALGCKSNLPQIVSLPDRIRDMLADVRVEPLVSPAFWFRLLAQHSRIWLPREHGGDGQEMRQALLSGAHVLCADTAIARRAHGQVGGEAQFYSARSSSDIADTLHRYEQTRGETPLSISNDGADDRALAIEVGFIVDRMQEGADV